MAIFDYFKNWSDHTNQTQIAGDNSIQIQISNQPKYKKLKDLLDILRPFDDAYNHMRFYDKTCREINFINIQNNQRSQIERSGIKDIIFNEDSKTLDVYIDYALR